MGEMHFDRNGLEVLSRAECLRLLGGARIGRVGLSMGALPAVLPVNFTLVDDAIVLRTAAGSKLDAALANSVVAFEVDSIDPMYHTGWSVLVQGVASEVVDPADRERLLGHPCARGPTTTGTASCASASIWCRAAGSCNLRQRTGPREAAAPVTTEHALPAALAETHISVLVSIGDRVFKLKKPVAMGFLDFSTLEARSRRLPSRGGAQSSLRPRRLSRRRRRHGPGRAGVRPPRGHASHAGRAAAGHIGHRGPLHRRSSAPHRARRRNLSRIGTHVRRDRRGGLAGRGARQLGRKLRAAEAVRRARARWNELRRAVEQLVHRYLDGRQPLFRRRMAERRVRDGHGDLQAEDIFCLDDGPRILDCIEFDDRLRHCDVLADVAFLAMDLERLGSPEGARRFLDLYRELSAETYPQTLAHHYVAYRAHVRAKVACLRHGQGDADAAAAATSLLELALRHLERGRVVIVLVGGLPGTGKSTLAAGIADAKGWSVLRSDEVRKDVAGLGHAERGRVRVRRGHLSAGAHRGYVPHTARAGPASGVAR